MVYTIISEQKNIIQLNNEFYQNYGGPILYIYKLIVFVSTRIVIEKSYDDLCTKHSTLLCNPFSRVCMW